MKRARSLLILLNLILLAMLSLASAVSVAAPASEPAAGQIAFLYAANSRQAGTWQAWLEENGYPTDILSLDQAAEVDLSPYATFLIGPESGNGGEWGGDYLVGRLMASGARIIGIGEGGYAFLGKTGAEIGYPHGAHGAAILAQLSCYVPALAAPRTLEGNDAGVIGVYNESTPAVVIHAPSPSADVFPLLGEANTSDYWPVIRQGQRLALWGFGGSPLLMTDSGRRAFLNLIDHMQANLRIYANTQVDTLVLSACQRMMDIGYNGGEVRQMTGRLQTLVHTPTLISNMQAVHKDLRSAPAAVDTALGLWAGSESNITRTNNLVAAIDDWIELLKQETFPNLKYVILVGAHEVIPMYARPADNYNENGWGLPQNSGYLYDIYHAGSDGHYLTDTPYGDLSYFNDGWGGNGVLRAELAVGRLVETPNQIRDLVDAYIAGWATMHKAEMMSAGSSDFMDGARAAANYMGATADDALIQASYNSSLVPPRINSNQDVVFLAGHGNYDWITTGSGQGFQSGPTASQGDMSEVNDLANAIVVADGCHNGVNFGNRLYHAPTNSPTYRDFPEEFAERLAGVYFAATGYTWVSISGSSDNPSYASYSEKLAALYVKHLLYDGYITSGQAYLAAVDEYLADAGAGAMGDGGHRRVLATYTLYGFPTYRWPKIFVIPYLRTYYPIRYWWEEEIIRRIDRTLLVRYHLRLPPIMDPTQVGIPGLETLVGLNQPLRPVLSVQPLLPPGSTVGAVNFDSKLSRSHTLSGPIPLSAMGNADATFGPRWESAEFDPPQVLSVHQEKGAAPSLQINPVQQRGGLNSQDAGASLAEGETRVWDELVFEVEYQLGRTSDNDKDGLPGYWEEAYGLDDNDPDGDNGPGGDPDGDDLSTGRELELGTNPIDPDSDNDGAGDGWEVARGSNPGNPGERDWFLHLPMIER